MGRWVRGWRFAGVAALSLSLAGCLGTDGMFSPTLLAPRVQPEHAPGAEKASDKLVVLPASAADLDCPTIDVFDGGATARVVGADNMSVRYQFDITDTARECDPNGNMFALKIGVSGRLLIGPAGSPGRYATTLRVEVERDIDQKVLFEKTYPVSADTQGGPQAPYKIVTEPIMLPLTRARLDMDYSIFVGLGAGGQRAVAHHHRARRRG